MVVGVFYYIFILDNIYTYHLESSDRDSFIINIYPLYMQN